MVVSFAGVATFKKVSKVYLKKIFIYYKIIFLIIIKIFIIIIIYNLL